MIAVIVIALIVAIAAIDVIAGSSTSRQPAAPRKRPRERYLVHASTMRSAHVPDLLIPRNDQDGAFGRA